MTETDQKKAAGVRTNGAISKSEQGGEKKARGERGKKRANFHRVRRIFKNPGSRKKKDRAPHWRVRERGGPGRPLTIGKEKETYQQDQDKNWIARRHYLGRLKKKRKAYLEVGGATTREGEGGGGKSL